MIGRVVAIAAMASIAGHAETTLRQPTGKWVVDFADNMCVLQRDYGTREAPIVLAFRPNPMDDDLTLYVLDRPTHQNGQYVSVKIGFGPGSQTVDTQMATFNLASRAFRFNETGLKRVELERAVASNTLSFEARGRMNATFSVPAFGPALKVLDQCVADLLDTWGFSRKRQEMIAELPKPLKPVNEYFSSSDYPTDAIRADQSGANSARYKINADGKISDCTIVETSKSDSLDKRLCQVVRRFRYKPAIDKAGKPMESIGFTRVRWALG